MSLTTERKRTWTLKNTVTNTIYLWLSIDIKKKVLNPAFSNFQQQKQTNQENNSYKTFWEKKTVQGWKCSATEEGGMGIYFSYYWGMTSIPIHVHLHHKARGKMGHLRVDHKCFYFLFKRKIIQANYLLGNTSDLI